MWIFCAFIIHLGLYGKQLAFGRSQYPFFLNIGYGRFNHNLFDQEKAIRCKIDFLYNKLISTSLTSHSAAIISLLR